MADKTINRIVPREGGKWYAIESSFDNGKTWHSSGNSSPTKEGAQKIIDNWSESLTSEGLTKEEAMAKAKAAPGPNIAQDIDLKLYGKDTDAADAETKGKTETTDKANQMSGSSKAKGNRIRNYLEDKTDTLAAGKSTNPFQKEKEAADAEAKGKTETTDKANQMSDSSKAETDTTATGKFINPFQKEKEAADKAVEDASILLDRVKQSADKVEKKFSSVISSEKGNILVPSPIIPESDKELLDLAKDTEILAKELVVDTGGLTEMKTVSNTLRRMKRLEKIHRKLIEAAEAKLAAAKAKQQEVQANYTKAEEEEAAKRKVESKPAPKAQKAETETEKDETKDPLEKAEKLEQPESQTPTDIKRFSNDLNRFVIQAYLNGDFGKKSSPNAIATMGFFILDKIGTAIVNASQVARGMSPSAKSQWSNVLDKQTELLGKRITADWLLSLPKEKLEALVRSGALQPVTGDDIYGTTDPNAVTRAAQRDILETSKLSQEQKGVAQSNINALLARKSELQTLIAQLRSDQGWEVYAQAMNAVVGTAKGLSTLGVTDNSNSSSEKGFSDTLSANVKTGKMTSAFVSGGISNNSTWNNSSAEALSKSNSLSQDALAYSKFKTGEDYANATREAKKAANEQLIKRLEGQIEIIDKCIDSWGKDLGL